MDPEFSYDQSSAVNRHVVDDEVKKEDNQEEVLGEKSTNVNLKSSGEEEQKQK